MVCKRVLTNSNRNSKQIIPKLEFCATILCAKYNAHSYNQSNHFKSLNKNLELLAPFCCAGFDMLHTLCNCHFTVTARCTDIVQGLRSFRYTVPFAQTSLLQQRSLMRLCGLADFFYVHEKHSFPFQFTSRSKTWTSQNERKWQERL